MTTVTANVDIHKILVQGVLASSLGLPTAWPNLPFKNKPADGLPWAQAIIVPIEGAVRVISLGDLGEDEHVGFMQVDLNYPIGKGETDQLAKMDVLSAFFVLGKQLAFGQTVLTVRGVGRSRGREADGFWRMSLTVNWTARTPRNPDLQPDFEDLATLLDDTTPELP